MGGAITYSYFLGGLKRRPFGKENNYLAFELLMGQYPANSYSFTPTTAFTDIKSIIII